MPFIAIGITKQSTITLPQIKFYQHRNFDLFRIKTELSYLKNDLEILEKKIESDSSFQKALIWFTRAKLSNTRIEEFMNYYRCIEEFSRDFNKKIDKEFDNFVKNKISTFDEKIIEKFSACRKGDSKSIEPFLMFNYIEPKIISKIEEFRNKQIAHGNDYAVEYNENLLKTIDEMEIFTQDIINQEIKKMKFEGLISPKFLYDYYIIISPSQRKIVLADLYDLKYFKEKLRNIDDKLIEFHGLGQIAEKDISSSTMLKEIKHITIDEELCKKLIKNFGKIIDY